MELTLLDAGLLGLVLVGGLWGYVAGALRVAGPLAVLIAVLTLVHAYPELSTCLGTHAAGKLFLPLLAGFCGVVVYGFVGHVLRGAVPHRGLGVVNPLLGLGLVTGTPLAGACVWGLHTYGGMSGLFVLHRSVVAPVVMAFFETIIAFTQRFFPRPEPAHVPW